jgi:predicted Na+-dependent transporter
MNKIKRMAGLIWMALAPFAVWLLASTAHQEIARTPTIDTRIQWTVFIIVFLPIAFGLLLFGWFAWKGEYDHLPESSAELQED